MCKRERKRKRERERIGEKERGRKRRIKILRLKEKPGLNHIIWPLEREWVREKERDRAEKVCKRYNKKEKEGETGQADIERYRE